MNDPAATAPGRVAALEALRGVAALVVVAFHTSDFLALSRSVHAALVLSPLGVLMNGPAAVHVFFVLSGYVLARSRDRDEGARGLAGYVVKRVLRIHPPYVLALLVAWGVSSVYLSGPLAGLTWPPGMRPVHIRPDQLQIALLFPSQAFQQLPVGWSLYVEMAMSLIFPALYLVGRRVHSVPMLMLAGWLHTVPVAWLGFTSFAPDFALGAAVHLERDRIAAWLGGRSRLFVAAAIALILLLLQGPYASGWLATGRATLTHAGAPGVVLPMALGSALAVALVVHVPGLRRGLETRPLLFLGRVSYSLYLLHLTVLQLVAAACGGGRFGIAAGLALFAGVTALSLAISAPFQRFVELPSLRAGRALARWISGPPRGTAAPSG